ncbi:hypothetical protein ACVXZ4_12925 [Lacisediminihabitans sp. FW035]
MSHGSLLVRSPKGPDAETNIDLVFSGVEYVACPRMLRGLELVEVTPDDIQRVGAEFGAVVAPNQVFLLLSAGARHLVIASSCRVNKNLDDIFDSSLV